MVHSVTTERRQHRRYLVEGKAVICTPSGESKAELVDVGGGGILVLSRDAAVAIGDPVDVRFTIHNYPLEIKASGRVARAESYVIGIVLTDPPPELDEVLLWLEAGFLATLL